MINFSFLPSLEHIAYSKLAIFLCSQKDILQLIPECSTLHMNQKWYNEVRIKILEKLNFLPLPKSHHAKLLCVVRQICFEIINWKIKQRNRTFYYFLLQDRLNLLQWTPLGRIDDVKTAEVLVKCGDIPAEKRYYVACFYALEKDVIDLQKELSEFPPADFVLYSSKTYISVVTKFWSYEENARGVLSSTEDITQISFLHLFRSSAYDDNIAGVKFFFNKLTFDEKESILVNITKDVAEKCILYSLFPDTFPSDTLFFLLSVMSTDEQIEVFKCRPVHILICFLYWPLLDYFFKMLDNLFCYLSHKDLYKLLKLGVMNVSSFKKEDFKPFSYPDVFEVIWNKSSDAFRKFVVDEFVTPGTLLLYYLVRTHDRKSISLVLDNAAIEEKKKINGNVIRVSYPNYFCFCEKLDLNKECNHDLHIEILHKQPLNGGNITHGFLRS